MSIFDKYDLIDVEQKIEKIEIPQHGLSVLVGSSGSGKTTQLGLNNLVYDYTPNTDLPIYQLFATEELAEKWLLTAGFRSVPAWRRSLSSVSNGERHRAEIAIKLANGYTAIDEFTSLVDRDTARALCESINKNKNQFERLVLATCHKDVLNWLDFDFAYDCDSNQVIERGSLRLDREIILDIRACETKAVWPIFKKHHYLSGEINLLHLLLHYIMESQLL